MKEFENKELAQFLENSVKLLFDLNPDTACIVAIDNNTGLAGTCYFNCEVGDKYDMIEQINADIILETIENNIDHFRDLILNESGEDDGDLP